MEIQSNIPITDDRVYYEVKFLKLEEPLSNNELYQTLFGKGEIEIRVILCTPVSKSFFYARRFDDESKAYVHYLRVCEILKSNPKAILRNGGYFEVNLLDLLINGIN
jgi:hypothetical protein